jgi:hypothetical protein
MGSLLQRTVKKPLGLRTDVFAVVLVITGPSLAGSADHNMSGIGTFIYCGFPIPVPAPQVMAAIGR